MIKIGRSLTLLCLVAGLHFHGLAQGIQVQATLDSTTIKLGSQSALHLRIEFPKKESISFPELGDSITSAIKIAQQQKPDTLDSKTIPGYRILNQTIRITSFDTGLHQIPPFTFKTKSGDLKTQSLQIRVMPVAVDTSKAFFDIKQPIAVSFSWIEWVEEHLGFIALVILGIILIVVLILYIQKLRKKLPPREPEKLIPAHILAASKLLALKEKKLVDPEEVKAYHSELSIIIREYIEKRYYLHAQEQATEDIIDGLKGIQMPSEARKDLLRVLRLSDFVKFAKSLPTQTENDQSIEHALHFVALTKQDAEPRQSSGSELKSKEGQAFLKKNTSDAGGAKGSSTKTMSQDKHTPQDKFRPMAQAGAEIENEMNKEEKS